MIPERGQEARDLQLALPQAPGPTRPIREVGCSFQAPPEGRGVKRAGRLPSLGSGHNLASSKRQNPTWLSRTGSKVTCSSKEPFSFASARARSYLSAKSPCIHSHSFIFLLVQQVSPEPLISIRQPADSGYRGPVLLSLQSSRGYTGRETSLNTRPECSGFGDSHSMLLWAPGA